MLFAGEIVKLTHMARGVDSNGVLQVDIVVTGSIPEFPQSSEVTPAKTPPPVVTPATVSGNKQLLHLLHYVLCLEKCLQKYSIVYSRFVY